MQSGLVDSDGQLLAVRRPYRFTLAERIEPVLVKSFASIAEYLHVAVPCLTMTREVIANKGVWTAKKRYILNVCDNEGVTYREPRLKIMGIEAVKSSTPAVCQEMITDVLKLFMNLKNQEGCIDKQSVAFYSNKTFNSVSGMTTCPARLLS